MLLVGLALAAEPLRLSYEEALRTTSQANYSVLDAVESVRSADGAVLAARSTFEPSLSLTGAGFASTDEGQFQFGQYFVDTSGFTSSIDLSQTLATGTQLGIGFSSDFASSKYRIPGFDDELGDPAWSTGLTFSLTQALLQGTRLRYNLQAVRGAVRARSVAEAARLGARQDALAATAQAYWALYLQRRLVAIADQTVAVTAEQARIVDALVEAGKLAPIERTRIAAAKAQADRAALDVHAAADAAQDAILVAMGEPGPREIELISTPSAPPELHVDEEQVVEGVLQGNPTLLAARLTEETAKAAVADARHALLPTLAATGSYGLRGYETTLSDSLDELGTGALPEWTLGGTLSLPIFNLADRGALAQRQAEAEQARLAVLTLEAALTQQVRAQVRTVVNARRAVELSAVQVKLAEETLAAERARMAEGRALQKDVIQAIKDVDQARVDAETTLVAYINALVEIDRLKGAL